MIITGLREEQQDEQDEGKREESGKCDEAILDREASYVKRTATVW